MITAKDIQSHWDLGPIHEMVEMSRFDCRSVWRIHAKNGVCVLKSASDWESDQELVTQLCLLDHLASKKKSIAPALIQTRNGLGFVKVAGNRWFATEFVAGITPEPTAKNYRKLGNVLAQLHGIKDFPMATEYTIENILTKEIPHIAAGLPFASEYLALARSLSISDSMPHSVIHTDPSLGNAILTQDGNIILIDWECSGSGTTIIDIGHQLLLRFITVDGDTIPQARAFYSSYFAAMPMVGYDARSVFEAGIMIALFFIKIGNMVENWKRITSTVNNRDAILDMLEECAHPARLTLFP